jgi:hypothetical protein
MFKKTERPSLRIILSLLFTLNLLFSADLFYIISYRVVSLNHTIKTEKLFASRAMIVNENLKPILSFEIERVKNPKKISGEFFKDNQDQIVEKLVKNGVFVNDSSIVRNRSNGLKTVLTLPPTTVSLSINDNFVKMTLYK